MEIVASAQRVSTALCLPPAFPPALRHAPYMLTGVCALQAVVYAMSGWHVNTLEHWQERAAPAPARAHGRPYCGL